jgi:cytochrome c
MSLGSGAVRGIAAALVALVAAACQDEGTQMAARDTGGDAGRGAILIGQVGCGGCHIVPGIPAAEGLVGPPLNHMARRVYVAGLLRNTPDNMVTWLMDPQRIVPGNAMPNMGLSEPQARDIAAYLYTLE